MMTLEQCVNALNALLNRNITYVGNEARFVFEDSSEAREIIYNARKALTTMMVISNAGQEIR